MGAMFAVGVETAAACPPPPKPEAVRAVASMYQASPALTPQELTDLTRGDPFYYTSDMDPRPATTHSKIPHLPVYYGYMQTNDTFRFVNINEQVLTMTGEGKHGLWRIQENGMIREYLRAGATGLPKGADVTDPDNFAAIKRDYSHFLPDEGSDGYKDPFKPVNDQGRLNFVDLPITHPKYEGRYRNHRPIDLPHWYCTMSEARFPEMARAARFAFAQKGANRIGPLGRRAGLDVKELYTNVLRLQPMPDARAYVNVGGESNVRWEAVDQRRTKVEYYLYERPFFNVPYMFLTAVFDNRGNRDFRYVRPDGPYHDHLVRRQGSRRGLKHKVTMEPRFHVEGRRGARRVTGTLLYGVHHPNRPAEYGDSGGGACPMKGGDWDGYPDTKGGAGWPTQYEEVTPLCDGVLLDIKFYANLDGKSWNDPLRNLANAGAGKRKVTYTVREGVYGKFVDPYNTRRGVENSQMRKIGPKVTLRFPGVRDPVRYRRVP